MKRPLSASAIKRRSQGGIRCFRKVRIAARLIRERHWICAQDGQSLYIKIAEWPFATENENSLALPQLANFSLSVVNLLRQKTYSPRVDEPAGSATPESAEKAPKSLGRKIGKDAMDVLVTNAINQLKKSIEDFDEKSAKQTAQMLRLTRAIAVLTFFMTAAVVVQICQAAKDLPGQ